jgi:hypothetical protein
MASAESKGAKLAHSTPPSIPATGNGRRPTSLRQSHSHRGSSGRDGYRRAGHLPRRPLTCMRRPPITVNVCLLSDWLEVLPT